MKNKENIKKKTAKVIVAASTASALVTTPVNLEDENIVNPPPISEAIQDEEEEFITVENVNKQSSKLFINTSIVSAVQIIGGYILSLLTNLINNPILRKILFSVLIIGLLICCIYLFIKKYFPNNLLDKFVKNKDCIIVICALILSFILLDIFASKYWTQYDKYGNSVKIAFSIIAFICVCNQIYETNRNTEKDKKLIVSYNDMIIEEK